MTERPAASPSPRRPGWSGLVPRLVTAAAGIPIVLSLIIAGGPLYTAAVAALLALGATEIARAAGIRAADPLTLCGAAAAAALAVAAHLHPDVRAGVLTVLIAATLGVVTLRAETADGFHRWATVVAGAVYVGVLGSHLVSLRLLEDGRAWVLVMVFTTFATDTGAYFVGRAFGRRKLAPRVSPGKTVAGASGGLVAAAIVAPLLSRILDLDQSLPPMAALGAVVAVAGEIGDLGESLLKRSLGVKDMGHLFPGHGGVLDRLDSILFAAPVVYYLARWLL